MDANNNHIDLAKIIDKSKVDILITFGNFSKKTSHSIKNKHIKTMHFNENQFSELKNKIKKTATKNDLIYLKGSRSMKLERIYK